MNRKQGTQGPRSGSQPYSEAAWLHSVAKGGLTIWRLYELTEHVEDEYDVRPLVDPPPAPPVLLEALKKSLGSSGQHKAVVNGRTPLDNGGLVVIGARGAAGKSALMQALGLQPVICLEPTSDYRPEDVGILPWPVLRAAPLLAQLAREENRGQVLAQDSIGALIVELVGNSTTGAVPLTLGAALVAINNMLCAQSILLFTTLNYRSVRPEVVEHLEAEIGNSCAGFVDLTDLTFDSRGPARIDALLHARPYWRGERCIPLSFKL